AAGAPASRGTHVRPQRLLRPACGSGVMRIRATLLALGIILLAMPTALEAQRAAGMSRIGGLGVCGPGPRRPHFDIFRARLAEAGYVEGKNLVIEQRFADCRYERMPGLGTEFVQAPGGG